MSILSLSVAIALACAAVTAVAESLTLRWARTKEDKFRAKMGLCWAGAQALWAVFMIAGWTYPALGCFAAMVAFFVLSRR